MCRNVLEWRYCLDTRTDVGTGVGFASSEGRDTADTQKSRPSSRTVVVIAKIPVPHVLMTVLL